ncbi:uncharacterized protein LOC132268425 [Cornus florida]|uniref:uncharacterized protein LOC132268425 n=1 Tax=Cornus florida TaxID=4283 RepID=UPI002897D199|nr:uncharacterized protein LOC132268425 [Cornus florida]
MAYECRSTGVDDAGWRRPVRATNANLYQWPESSVNSNGRRNHRVVDSVSCRRLYLKSYTFTRKESASERIKKCLGRVRQRVLILHRRNQVSHGGRGGRPRRRRKCAVIGRAKEVSCAAALFIFRRLLSCTTKVVDVVRS